MPATRLIAVNGSAGAVVAVASTIPARRVFAREDESVTAQGLTYNRAEDNFVASYTVGTPGTPDQQQIQLPDPSTTLSGKGAILAWPAQGSSGAFNFIAAGTYFKVISKSATTTKIRVVESE